jgi:peptidoglycan/xylan/chitin deacetylase (PgdA/CDA1 family)
MDFLLLSKIKSIKFPLKSIISKLSFELGRNPVIEKTEDWQKFIPKPFKSVLILSSDFELAWAFRFSKSSNNPLVNALQKARDTRFNFPGLMALCEKYNIPITWATVGHLFLDSCSRDNGNVHSDVERLLHFESPFWKFSDGDWFKDDPCSNLQEAPEWYSPDLIKQIIESPVKHEIGSHTFSHIDCRDHICPPSVFKSELTKCVEVAKDFGVELRSFVYPGHTFGNHKYLSEHGFTSYRTNYSNILGYPVKRVNGLWEHKSSGEFEYRPSWSKEYQIKRFKKIIDRAINSHTVCHFWFHPSFKNLFLTDILPSVFEHIKNRRNEIFVTTMGEYTDWLNQNNK